MKRTVTVFAVAVSALTLGACSGDDDDAAPARTTTSATTPATTLAPAPSGVAPLLGMPGSDPAKLGRPALIVKIDNAPKARPQVGINQADVIVEEGVEGGITRFATMFHSQDSDPVGPVRSARTTDIAIATPLGHPLFAYSGTNSIAQAALDRSAVVNVGISVRPGAYRRQTGRPAPYNLFSTTPALFAGANGAPPPPLFHYRGAGTPAGGRAVSGIDVRFVGRVVTAITWRWDAGAGAWRRTQKVTPGDAAVTAHVDAGGTPVGPRNVVVQFVDYEDTGIRDQSGEPVPEAKLVGEGDAWVLTDGKLIDGRWRKATVEAVTEYTTADGKPIELTPGQTWVVLPKPGMASVAS